MLSLRRLHQLLVIASLVLPLPTAHCLEPIPDKLVVLSFDDGNKSDRAFVARVLKEHGFGATFYITEGLGFLNNKTSFLTWKEVRELQDMGFEIGNHTQHHRNVTTLSADDLKQSIQHIQDRCTEHGIPTPTTFCYPGFSHGANALKIVDQAGFLFARRGVGPEYPDGGNGARGPAYDPETDHPLLIPTTGYDGPHFQFEDFKWGVSQARDGKIAVFAFHGIPALEHPWVSTDPEAFRTYMQYLKDEGCTVIAMRDLARYVDPSKRPAHPYSDLENRRWQPIEPTTIPLPNPLGLDLGRVTFEWKLTSTNRIQSACQVLVASSEPKLIADAGNIWDSGKLHDPVTAIAYRGKPLPRDTKLWWKVRVWDDQGKPGLFGSPQQFVVSSAPTAKPRTRTASGSVKFTAAKLNQGAQLDGNSSIHISDYPELRPASATTLSAWIRPDNTDDEWQTIFRKEDGNDRRLLAIGKTGTIWGVWLGLGINGAYNEFGSTVSRELLGDKKWHHIAGTYDGRSMRIYVDGKDVRATQDVTGKLGKGGNATAHIGAYGTNAEAFHGGIDDMRVYDRALTPDEIQQLANAKVDVATNHIAGWWKLDGNLDNEITVTTKVSPSRVAFLGGRVIADMSRHGYLETALTVLWPHDNLTFRNLGWPADDVFGTARSEFGSDVNTRSWRPPGAKQGFGYQTLIGQLNDASPSTVLVAYGSETAFHKTAQEFEDFKTGYRNLINDIEKVAASVILMGPARQENLGAPFPDPRDRNERLQHASNFIRDLARERGHRFVDLYQHLIPANGGKNLTDNGFHLNAKGYQQMARIILDQLGLTQRPFEATFSKAGQIVSTQGAQLNDLVQTSHGFRFDLTPETLPALPTSIAGTIRLNDSPGNYHLRIDGHEVLHWTNGKEGAQIKTGLHLDPSDALRQTIIEKNQLYTYRLRPLNKTYIFLFRRYEMGHLAYEMEDFERLAQEKEELIARLRVPKPQRFVIEGNAPWKSPRKYPDHEVPSNIPAPDIAAELKQFTVADGFNINLFAANPMIANPINLNWDTRGRLWVSTSSTYPHIKPGRQPNDRIVIIEDVDQDGVADRSTVFAEGLLVPHSVMPVPGGAFVCSSTEFLFLADHDGDDREDERRVVYAGFGNADVHHMIHGLRWAPWGELYFIQSIYINSFIETLYGPRRLNGSGIWRFRPETERLEIFARGMVNPWGHAFDHWGQSFATDGAGGSGPHHAFPGAAFNTATGAERVLSGLIPGKPKNTAAEFVSGSHAPDHWQGSLLANDFRANRTIRYELKENGSGFSAAEVETVLHSKHRSFRPVDIKMGPDGAIYVVDWYNPIIDHGEVDFHHPKRDKSHGRIWRLTAKDRPLAKRPNIFNAPIPDLLDHLKAPEEWTRVQTKRELATRKTEDVLTALDRWLGQLDHADAQFEHHQLEALWLRGHLRSPDSSLLTKVSNSTNHQARAAATRMMFHWFHEVPNAIDLLSKAVIDEHPRVRLEAVNALREIGTLEACNIALRALDLPGDKNLDYSLRLTVRDLQSEWLPALQAGKTIFDGKVNRVAYALDAATDRRALGTLIRLIREGKVADKPNALKLVASLGGKDEMEMVFSLAAKARDPELLQAVVDAARSNPAVPDDTSELSTLSKSKHQRTRILAATLIGLWKVPVGRDFITSAINPESSSEERLAVDRALVRLGKVQALQEVTASSIHINVKADATAAWAEAHPADAASSAVSLLGKMKSASKAEVLYHSYVSRKDGPDILASALANHTIPSPIAAAGIRIAQASGREMPQLIQALTRAGSLQPVNADLTKTERTNLLKDANTRGSFARGAAVFKKPSIACVTCHAINGKGGQVGPELGTLGTFMTPESILESLLNPNSSIKQGYETIVVTLKDEEILTGTLQRKTDNSVLLRDATGHVNAIPNNEIENIDSSPVSLMPPGITTALRRDELVDLLHYLTHLGK